MTGPQGAKGLLLRRREGGPDPRDRPPRQDQHVPRHPQGRVADDGERGLLSVAFPPKYAQNGLFYVYYTEKQTVTSSSPSSAARARTRAGRSAKAGRTRDQDQASARRQPQRRAAPVRRPTATSTSRPATAAAAATPTENAQNLDSLLGKLIRIDPRRHGSQPYSVPGSNPFVGAPGRDEIYAYGLRNPYRFSFDRPAGHLVIGDVGQDTLGGDRLPAGRCGSRRQLRLGCLRGLRSFRQHRREPDPGRPRDPADPSVQPRRRQLRGHRRLRLPRSEDAVARWSLHLRGLLQEPDPQPDSRRRRASDDRPVAGLPSFGGISSFGEDTKGGLYFTDLGSGGVYEIAPKP